MWLENHQLNNCIHFLLLGNKLHSHGGFKNHTFSLHFQGSGVSELLSWIPCSESQKAAVQVWVGGLLV